MGEGKRRRDRGWTRDRAIAARLEREREDARYIADAVAHARTQFPDAVALTAELALELVESATVDEEMIWRAMDEGALIYVPSLRQFLTVHKPPPTV